MGFFSSKNTARFGVIIEVGSGSIAVAAICSRPESELPEIIWSKRVAASLRNIEDIHDSAKSVLATLVDTLLEFQTTGLQALAAHTPGAKISSVQCTVGAPWSYTITKRINYEQEEPFEVTTELLEELASAARKKTEEIVAEHKVASALGLTIATRATIHTALNDYPTKSPEGKQAKKISLVHTSMVTQSYLQDTLKELHKKIFPGTKLEIYTYATVFNCVVSSLLPQHKNVALLDVTAEATEISVVREGILSYVTHTPFGIFSLAREIANITGDPLPQAHKLLLREDFTDYVSSLTKAKQADISALLDNYTARLTELLKETGDELAMPRQIMLHAPSGSFELFADLLTKASKKAAGISPTITNITAELLKNNPDIKQPTDLSILLSAYFYHHGNHCFTVEHTH